MIRNGKLARVAGAVVSALALAATAACGGGGQQSADGVIQYWLWDSAQQPGYQRCADDCVPRTRLEVAI